MSLAMADMAMGTIEQQLASIKMDAFEIADAAEALALLQDAVKAPMISVDTETVGKYSLEMFLKAERYKKGLHRAEDKALQLELMYARSYRQKATLHNSKQGKKKIVYQESADGQKLTTKAKEYLVNSPSLRVRRAKALLADTLKCATSHTGGLHFYENLLGCFQIGYYDQCKQCFVVGLIRPDVINQAFKDLLVQSECIKLFHNYKFDYEQIKQHLGIVLPWYRVYDTQIAEHLLTCGKGHSVSLKNTVKRRFGIELDKAIETRVSNWLGAWSQEQIQYAALDVVYPLLLANAHKQELVTDELVADENRERFEAISRQEFACVPCLAEMEMAGVHIDKPYVEHLLDRKLPILHDAAGQLATLLDLDHMEHDDFVSSVANSPKVLVNHINDVAGTSLTSTGKEALKTLQKQRPDIVEALWSYRKAFKLITTYIKPFIEHSVQDENGDWLLYGNFNQAIVRTGRLSSGDPVNFQNMPKTEEFRRVIIATEGHKLVRGDLATIEPRIVASISKDPVLLRSFERGEDVYQKTASLIFGMDYEVVPKDLRNVSKALMLSIIYGKTVFGFAIALELTESAAAQLLSKFFGIHYGVKKWLDDTKASLLENGYVETLGGRRRYIPEIHSSNRWEVDKALREGPNTVVQGTAADCMKRSIVRAVSELERRTSDESKLILSVHDELVARAPDREAALVSGIIERALIRGSEELVPDVPILVGGPEDNYSINVVQHWGECVA